MIILTTFYTDISLQRKAMKWLNTVFTRSKVIFGKKSVGILWILWPYSTVDQILNWPTLLYFTRLLWCHCAETLCPLSFLSKDSFVSHRKLFTGIIWVNTIITSISQPKMLVLLNSSKSSLHTYMSLDRHGYKWKTTSRWRHTTPRQ